MAASAELEDLCLGGADEMERLLALEPGALREECCSISARIQALQELNLPASWEFWEQAPRAVVGLFKLWTLTQVYQREAWGRVAPAPSDRLRVAHYRHA